MARLRPAGSKPQVHKENVGSPTALATLKQRRNFGIEKQSQ
jgi:hypothetical protein